MKPTAKHIEYFRKEFALLQTKDDVLAMLNTALKIVFPKTTKGFTIAQLHYFADPRRSKNRYRTFTISKKSGGQRTIHAPHKRLNYMLRSLNFVLQCVAKPHSAATGFVPGKAITDNAVPHVGAPFVYNVDLKDFFHSFDRNRVKVAFMYHPFDLSKEREPLAFMLASLCTHPLEIDGNSRVVLPQGAPTSPTLTNILCRVLDRRLSALAKRYDATYTRYADDITFSAAYDVTRNESFINELDSIVEKKQKLAFNTKKTRLQDQLERQTVTGLVVNEKVNVRRSYVKQVRMYLYLWERYGYDKACEKYAADRLDGRNGQRNGIILRNVLAGKLDFMRMVKGESDPTYTKLNERYVKLIAAEQLSKERKADEQKLKNVLRIWENQGIEAAIRYWYSDGLPKPAIEN